VLQVLYYADKRSRAAIVNLGCQRLWLIVLLDFFSDLLSHIREFCLGPSEEEHSIPFYSSLFLHLCN
jgi:hypothetical protein